MGFDLKIGHKHKKEDIIRFFMFTPVVA